MVAGIAYHTLKLQCTCKHAAPLERIIMAMNKSDLLLLPDIAWWVVKQEIEILLFLILPDLEYSPLSYLTRGEQSNHCTNEAINIKKIVCIKLLSEYNIEKQKPSNIYFARSYKHVYANVNYRKCVFYTSKHVGKKSPYT